MPDAAAPTPVRSTWLRTAAAVLAGLAGAVFIWLVTPYNNFIIGSSYISDSYLPVVGLFTTLVLVLGLNPVLHRLRPRLAFDRGQLSIAVGLMLMACVLPGHGLLRMLPYALAKCPLDVRDNARLAEAYQDMHLPAALFPDKMGFRAETPNSEYAMTELPPGVPVPWGAWLPPLVAWGTFLLACWLMMIGLALIVLPQWRHNERLPFPLLVLEQQLVEPPESGRILPPLFRRRSFWVAALTVFGLHVLAGWQLYNPEGVCAIPLKWDLRRLFTEEPLVFVPAHIYANRVYFIFVAAAFFMPTRIGFSIWFFVLAYAGYVVVGRAYTPPFYANTIVDHRVGAMLSLTGFVLWLGRAHWAHVFRCLVRPARSDEDRRDRAGGLLFTAGCAGMAVWLVWVGVPWPWALFYVFFAFMVSLLITRLVSETGMPFIRLDCGYQIGLVKMAPTSWLDPVTLYFAPVIAMLFPTASRVSCAAMATHAIGLDPDENPRRQARLAVGLVLLLALGLVICGAAHLYYNYRYSMTLDGREQPISQWGTEQLANANRDVLLWKSGQVDRQVYNQSAHLAFGAGLAGALQWACLAMPRWPLHPIGLLMVSTFFANEAWVSVFIGWLLKILLVRYGGPRLYRAAVPAMLGLVMGEVFAAVFWGLVPALLVYLHRPYLPVQIQPY